MAANKYMKRVISLSQNKNGLWYASIQYKDQEIYVAILKQMIFSNSDAAFSFCCDLIDEEDFFSCNKL